MTRDELTDLISDAISDSIDMDWQPGMGARAVVEALIKAGFAVETGLGIQSEVGETVSEMLEILGRGADPEWEKLTGYTKRERGVLRLLGEATARLDSPPAGGWPGTGTVAQRRVAAHLAMFTAEALAKATRKG